MNAFLFSVMLQAVVTPSDLPPASAPVNEGDVEFADYADEDMVAPEGLDRIYVRDSSEALLVEVTHPLQPICVRKLMIGSRVKARTFCQDKTSWIAHSAAMDAMIDSWANTATPLEDGGDATAGKSFGMGR